MTTSHGRRRQQFPGVPAPGGGPDVEATHVWPGMADELRAEQPLPERRDPALAEPLQFVVPPGTAEGDTVRVVPDPVREPEGVRMRVDEHVLTPSGGRLTVTPLDEQGEPTAAPFTAEGTVTAAGLAFEPPDSFVDPFGDPETTVEPNAPSVDVWGGDRPGVGHLGLGQQDVDDEPEPDGPDVITNALGDGSVVSTHPAPELLGALGPATSDGTAPEGDGPEIDPSHPDGIEVRFGCGCSIVLQPCRT